jgi:hypothetical protein
MKAINLSLVILFTFILNFSVQAKYTRTVKVKYQKQYGWSKLYTVDVTFMTGYEMNQATRTYDYNMYSVYGVIFWGDGQASIIQLSSYLICGTVVTRNCIDNSIYDLQGNDQDGTKWNFCLGNYCY